MALAVVLGDTRDMGFTPHWGVVDGNTPQYCGTCETLSVGPHWVWWFAFDKCKLATCEGCAEALLAEAA